MWPEPPDPTCIPSLTGDAFHAPLPGGTVLTLAVLEEEAELLGVVPRPPVAVLVRLAVVEALGDAMAHLEVRLAICSTLSYESFHDS